MDIDSFLEDIAGTNVRLPTGVNDRFTARPPESVDALFHLPLLALAIMTIARRSPFSTVSLGRRVASVLVEHFSALRSSPHNLEFSLTLRRRCVQALVFLELAGLATVSRD